MLTFAHKLSYYCMVLIHSATCRKRMAELAILAKWDWCMSCFLLQFR